MSEMHYRSIMDLSEVDGYSGLTAEGRDVFGKIFNTARSAHATEEGSLVVDWVRVRPEKISKDELRQVLGILGTVSGIELQTRQDEQVEGAANVRAIPEDVKTRLAKAKTRSKFINSMNFEDIFKEMFGGFR